VVISSRLAFRHAYCSNKKPLGRLGPSGVRDENFGSSWFSDRLQPAEFVRGEIDCGVVILGACEAVEGILELVAKSPAQDSILQSFVHDLLKSPMVRVDHV
jgi:hypothetical protein